MSQEPMATAFGVADQHVESFVDSLRIVRYADSSVRSRRGIAMSFARWTRDQRVRVADLDDSHLLAFLRTPFSGGRFTFKRGTLRRFLHHLREQGVVGVAKPADGRSPAYQIEQRYADYLRNERGLAERSVTVYLPYVRDLLSECDLDSSPVGPDAFNARVVCNFLLDRVRGRSTEYGRLLTAALRSFLRFLFLRGEIESDLSRSVPSVRRWSLAGTPDFLSTDEVTRVLSVTDRSTPRGRRDHAILLFLARLGLRAGEIVGLDLDDLRWRAGEVVIRGKGNHVDRLPLPFDVGDAVALYLRKDRDSSASRHVFLRLIPPHVGLAGPAAVGHVVRLAFSRAGITRSGRGAAHLFRHSLATNMIRQGASMAEISEVLRHRSQNSTMIYAKVAFDALREVARPWPGKGGA